MKIVMREGGEDRNVLRFKFFEREEPISTQPRNREIFIHRGDAFSHVEEKIGASAAQIVLEIWRIIPSLAVLKVRPNQIILGLEIGQGWSPENEELVREVISDKLYYESITWFVHRWNENEKPL